MVGVQLVTETSILGYFIAVIPSSADPLYRYANLSTLLTDLIFAYCYDANVCLIIFLV